MLNVLAVASRGSRLTKIKSVLTGKNGCIYYMWDGEKVVKIVHEDLMNGMAKGSLLVENARLLSGGLVQITSNCFGISIYCEVESVSIKEDKLVIVDTRKRTAEHKLSLLGLQLEEKEASAEKEEALEEKEEVLEEKEEDGLDAEELFETPKEKVEEQVEKVEEQVEIIDARISDNIVERFSQSIEEELEGAGGISAEEMLASEMETYTYEMPTGLNTCPICGGKGWYTDNFGVRLRCSCVSDRAKIIASTEKNIERASSIVKGTYSNEMVEIGLLKASRKNDYYDRKYTERFLKGLLSTFTECSCGSREEFYTTAESMIVHMQKGELPKHSYFISAPNGCGKETLANTLLKLAYASRLKVVPYISLLELTDLKLDKERKGRYNFDDYVAADLCCVYMASGDPRAVINGGKADDTVVTEFSTLETLLKLRGFREKPTLVFSTRRIQLYRAVRTIDSSFIYNMYTSDERYASMERMTEISIQFGVAKRVKTGGNANGKQDNSK